MERNELGQFVKGHKFWLNKKRTNISKEKNYNWHNGKMIQNGYVCVLCPNHPKSKSKKGYVYEHRLIIEKKLGCFLKKGEVIHHLDGNKLNNNLSNLRLFKNNAEHLKFHGKIKK